MVPGDCNQRTVVKLKANQTLRPEVSVEFRDVGIGGNDDWVACERLAR